MGSTINVSIISIPPFPIDYDVFWNLLSDGERVKGASFIFGADRWRYVFCRAFLRSLIGTCLNCSPSKIAFYYSTYGKPYLNQAHEFKFNLSHTGSYLTVAWSKDCEVGIDIEEIRPIDYISITQSYFSESERNQIDQHKEENKRINRFFACWTRKEALLKGMGLGIGIGIDLIRNQDCLANKIETPSQLWSFVDLQAPENHSLALAYLGEDLSSITLNNVNGSAFELNPHCCTPDPLGQFRQTFY